MSSGKKYFEHETVKSLQWYFGIVGFGGLYYQGTALWNAVAASASATTLLNLLWGLVVSAGFVYFTYTLPIYLHSNKVHILKNCIHILFGVSLVGDIIGNISGGTSLGWLQFVPVLVGLFIWWYLYQSVSRLSGENK